jgi:hypothetical protein
MKPTTSSQSRQSWDDQNDGMLRCHKVMMQNLMQNQQYIITDDVGNYIQVCNFFNFITILLDYVTNGFFQQWYNPYGPSALFPHPTT